MSNLPETCFRPMRSYRCLTKFAASVTWKLHVIFCWWSLESFFENFSEVGILLTVTFFSKLRIRRCEVYQFWFVVIQCWKKRILNSLWMLRRLFTHFVKISTQSVDIICFVRYAANTMLGKFRIRLIFRLNRPELSIDDSVFNGFLF